MLWIRRSVRFVKPGRRCARSPCTPTPPSPSRRHRIDSTAGPLVADALQFLGGARVVLATTSNSAAITATVDGLSHRGELVVIGADTEPLGIVPVQLLMRARTVRGHPAGGARDIQDAMAFSALQGVRPMIETVPLDRVGEAYHRMLRGAARFRMVLITGTG